MRDFQGEVSFIIDFNITDGYSAVRLPTIATCVRVEGLFVFLPFEYRTGIPINSNDDLVGSAKTKELF